MMEKSIDKTILVLNPPLAKLSMLLSGICMGTVGIFLVYLQGAGYSINSIIFFRGVFGTILLSPFMIKSNSFNKKLFLETFKFHWKNLLLSNIFYALMVISYLTAILILGFAVPAFLLYTSGIFFSSFFSNNERRKNFQNNYFFFHLGNYRSWLYHGILERCII
ncbi:MAG: hypothetical protein ACTSYC_10020 [Promethearchaeota archaeon]